MQAIIEEPIRVSSFAEALPHLAAGKAVHIVVIQQSDLVICRAIGDLRYQARILETDELVLYAGISRCIDCR